jgi:hypothetical protein
MNAVPFDTLKLARDFESAGLAPPVAGGAAAALADALIGADLATRADLLATRAELKSDLAHLETKMQAGFAAVASKLELLRRDMTIKLGGMIFIAVGVLLTAMRLMPHP